MADHARLFEVSWVVRSDREPRKITHSKFAAANIAHAFGLATQDLPSDAEVLAVRDTAMDRNLDMALHAARTHGLPPFPDTEPYPGMIVKGAVTEFSRGEHPALVETAQALLEIAQGLLRRFT